MYSLILLNGGVGYRVGGSEPKQFMKVKGIPILIYSLIAVDKIESINQIILNYPPSWRENIEKLIKSYTILTPITLVEAGDSRHSSVAKMLPYVTNENVIIHESARPLVTQKDFEILIENRIDNLAYMVSIPFTVAPVDPNTQKVTGYLNRNLLRNVQLPQKFNKITLEKAYEYAINQNVEFTEDATLVASAGFDVFYLEGSYKNIKITTPIDITIATRLLQVEEEHE